MKGDEEDSSVEIENESPNNLIAIGKRLMGESGEAKSQPSDQRNDSNNFSKRGKLDRPDQEEQPGFGY
jgi:hypothetical protein